MASFDDFGDEMYDDMFLTQHSNAGALVSLEDNEEFRTVNDPKYSDISDEETDQMEGRLR